MAPDRDRGPSIGDRAPPSGARRRTSGSAESRRIEGALLGDPIVETTDRRRLDVGPRPGGEK
jgi:hypothetical protein